MIAVILLTVPLVIMLCVLAYRLATFALPFMLALEAARFAYGTGGSEPGLLGSSQASHRSAFSSSCSPCCACRSCASPWL